MNPLKVLHILLAHFVFGKWLHKVVVFLSVYAAYATSLQMLRLVPIEPLFIINYIPILFGIMTLLILIKCRKIILMLPRYVGDKVKVIPVYAIFYLGLALRVLWVLFFNAEPSSDGATYLALAEKLVSGAEYEIANTKAYWPVGFPFYLSAWLLILPDAKFAYLVSNLFIYVISFGGVLRIVACQNEASGKLGLITFVLWPNLIFNSATPEKEMLVIALLLWAFYFLIKSIISEKIYWPFLCGLLLGGMILIQPSLQLVPVLILIVFFVLIHNKKMIFSKSFLLILGVFIVVAPWSIRNYHVFGEFVLVSTNGGDNLYRANNPLATGGYTENGEINLDNLKELEKDQVGKKLGKKWILENPMGFTKLVLEKQIRFVGDDSVGVYNTLKVGKASDNTLFYIALKILSNAWWWFIWLVLGCFALEVILLDKKVNGIFALSLWFWLYLFVIHSVFESAGKYHVPVLWVLCVLIGLYTDDSEKDCFNINFCSLPQRYIKAIYQFKKFMLIGGFSTGIQYIILIWLVHIYRVEAIVASGMGFIVSAGLNYYLNYRITFFSKISHITAFPRFILTSTSGLIINTTVVWFGVNSIGVHYLLVQVVSTCIVLFWNFIVNKIWVFSNAVPLRY